MKRVFDMAVYEMKHDTERCIIVLRDITEQEEMQKRIQRIVNDLLTFGKRVS